MAVSGNAVHGAGGPFRNRHVASFLRWAIPAVLSGLLALPAGAQEDGQPGWYGSVGADETTLIYGVRDSDENVLSFRCTAGEPDLQIRVHREPIRSDGGEDLGVSMRAGDVEVGLVGRGEIEQNYGMLQIEIVTPLDDRMRYLLTSGKPLSVTVEGQARIFDMEDASGGGRMLVRGCGSKTAAGNLDVTVVNGAKRPIQSLALAEAGSGTLDSDLFGHGGLPPGAKHTFTILGGRDICTFDFWVELQEEDEDDCCGSPAYNGTQDLCRRGEFTVRDVPAAAPEPPAAAGADPWVGEWAGDGLSATIRRGTAKPEFLVIELVTGQAEPACAGAVTLYGEPQGNRVVGESYDPDFKAAPVCRVEVSFDGADGLTTEVAGPCTVYHGAACGFDGRLERMQ